MTRGIPYGLLEHKPSGIWSAGINLQRAGGSGSAESPPARWRGRTVRQSGIPGCDPPAAAVWSRPLSADRRAGLRTVRLTFLRPLARYATPLGWLLTLPGNPPAAIRPAARRLVGSLRSREFPAAIRPTARRFAGSLSLPGIPRRRPPPPHAASLAPCAPRNSPPPSAPAHAASLARCAPGHPRRHPPRPPPGFAGMDCHGPMDPPKNWLTGQG